jgi:hypothetical protein
MVKRYDLDQCEGEGPSCSASMYEDAQGDYVTWADHDALRAKLAEAEAVLQRIAFKSLPHPVDEARVYFHESR